MSKSESERLVPSFESFFLDNDGLISYNFSIKSSDIGRLLSEL